MVTRRLMSIVVALASVAAVVLGFSGAAAATTSAAGWFRGTQIDDQALADVSCWAPRQCVAVDEAGRALRLSHGSWSSPVPVDDAGLYSVSCTGYRFCMAVDGWGGFLIYDGRTWSAPQHYDDEADDFAEVSCASRTLCVSVSLGSVAMVWDGTTWTPSPELNVEGDLRTVACAADYCFVSDYGPYLTRYDNGVWGDPVLVQLPGVVRSLTCSDDGECSVASDYGYVNHYDGTTWQQFASQVITRHQEEGPDVQAISCVSGGDCAMVDYYGEAVVETDGVWGPATRVRHDARGFQSVSCTGADTAMRCVAVTRYGQSYTYHAS